VFYFHITASGESKIQQQFSKQELELSVKATQNDDTVTGLETFLNTRIIGGLYRRVVLSHCKSIRVQFTSVVNCIINNY
jgi:hypothetical protein